jgi:hypothetical protein
MREPSNAPSNALPTSSNAPTGGDRTLPPYPPSALEGGFQRGAKGRGTTLKPVQRSRRDDAMCAHREERLARRQGKEISHDD